MTTPRLHDTFTGRVRLEGALTTRTALHIGAGASGDPLGTDAPVVRSAGGEPYIPGASLKGVLRSAAEALCRGFASNRAADAGRPAALWSCNPVGGRPCLTHIRLQALRVGIEAEERQAREAAESEGPTGQAGEPAAPAPAGDPRRFALEVWKESCPVCRLFGSLALASRVRFPDLPLDGSMPPFELRNGVGIDRDRELAADKVLYDFEAVPPGTRFQLTVLVDNPSDEEVGLLLYLFEELDRGYLALGGKSSRGLGLVGVEWSAVHETLLERDNPFTDLLSTRDLLVARGEREGEAGTPTAAEPPLPPSGDPEVWKQLLGLLRELPGLPRIDKGQLGARGAPLGLTKQVLARKLALGEGEKQVRRAWDLALEGLAAYGHLRQENGEFFLGGAEAPGGPGTAEAPPARRPELQRLYDRYVGAIARLWEEAR